MKNIFFKICLISLSLFGAINGVVASELPKCSVLPWHNCFGASVEGSDSYEGEWRNGKMNGHGTLSDSKGKYIGQFKNGKMNGQGILTYTNVFKYEGGLKDNELYGQGILTMASGIIYEGEWRGMQMTGTHTSLDGTIKKGIFKNGTFHEGALASYAPVPNHQVSPSVSIMTTYIGRARAEKERIPLQGRVYQCWNDKINFTTFNNGRKTFVDVTAADYTGMINFRGDYNAADQTFEGTHKFSRYWSVNVRGEIEGDYALGSIWYTISNSPGWNTDAFCISHFKVYKKDT